MGEENDTVHTIVKNTEKLREEKSLLDFIVIVEDVELPCHRVILAASSHFFRALLTSNMKEAQEGHVTLHEVSLNIFKLILKSLYTGKIRLTLENFVDIWQAADQLQIDFVVGHCEEFAKTLTCVEIYGIMQYIANILNSENILSFLESFLLLNFDNISEVNAKPIMELGFDDFNKLIESRQLNVRNEDWVIRLVLKWVEYTPVGDDSDDDDDECADLEEDVTQGSSSDVNVDNRNNILSKRIRRLARLLRSVRTCLVSTPLLKDLLKHRLIINNIEARDVLIDAVLYKTTHYNHGQWRTSAIHRASSEWEHCGILYVMGVGFVLLSVFDKKNYTCVNCSECLLDVTLVVFDSYLFTAGVKDVAEETSSLCVLSGNSWKKITEIPARQLILVPYDEYIFILSRAKPEIYQVFPKCGNPNVKEFTKLPDTMKVQLAVSYQTMILIFSAVTVNGKEKTAVHQLDILTKKLTELEQLNGPADHLTNFNDDNNIYFLQKTGHLWTVKCNAGKVTFKFLCRLWNTMFILHGAYTTKNHLHIAYPRLKNRRLDHEMEFSPQLKGYFKDLSLWSLNDIPCSNCIPVVLPKNILKPLIEQDGNLFIG
ncbi:kelch repeat and BTB domain-containing protein 3-like [Physella acuta]|uniref:kelch repeat and BTB domain-containing protein 3-like n=1 Tax=Physella acuta TaxID=109671 RepID=UPI0027DE34CF|nr:kelch repeat and BTB domain-containing protein 3-like [Physella acuta]